MSGEERRTPDEWCRLKGVRILDPDGWRDESRALDGDPT